MDIAKWQNTWNRLVYGWDLAEIGQSWMIVPDFSHWSVNSEWIDEEKFAQQIQDKNVKAIIAKGTDADRITGKQFIDSKAAFWHRIAEKYGLAIGYYHWLQQSVDPTVAYNFYRKFKEDYPTQLPDLVDFEEPSVVNYSDYIWRLEVWTEASIERMNGDHPPVYTGGWYLDRIRKALGASAYQRKMSKFGQLPGWFALYSRQCPARYCQLYGQKFAPWDSNGWVAWQYSDAADFPYYLDNDQYNGRSWGISSGGLDMNFVKWDWLKKYVGGLSPSLPPMETPPSIVQYRVTATAGLRIRASATTNSSKIGSLVYGTIVSVETIYSNNWGKLSGRSGYICLDYAEKVA